MTKPAGAPRHRVGLLTGCVQSVFFSGVNAATARVLAAEGCEVVAPQRQGCCGALSVHAGRDAEAQAYARALIETFEAESVDFIVVNAAGCGAAMKAYGRLLGNDPAFAARASAFEGKVRDFSQFLHDVGPIARRHRLAGRVTYHDACHLQHGQRVHATPRTLLRSIPGLELCDSAEPDICCGSAGVFNLLQTEPARELGERKARHLLATGADVVATSNPGCMLQIRASLARQGAHTPVLHVAEVLAASLDGADRAVR